jgi:hypothetical protein
VTRGVGNGVRVMMRLKKGRQEEKRAMVAGLVGGWVGRWFTLLRVDLDVEHGVNWKRMSVVDFANRDIRNRHDNTSYHRNKHRSTSCHISNLFQTTTFPESVVSCWIFPIRLQPDWTPRISFQCQVMTNQHNSKDVEKFCWEMTSSLCGKRG